MTDYIEEATRLYALMQEQVTQRMEADIPDGQYPGLRSSENYPARVVTEPNIEAQIKVLADHLREVRESCQVNAVEYRPKGISK